MLTSLCFTAQASWREGRVVASGPAWAVDVARYTGHVQQPSNEERNGAQTVYVPVKTRWITYVIEDGGTTYICREKGAREQVEIHAGDAVLFSVKRNRLRLKSGGGAEHKAFLVQR
jgi:hypothetical protein